jgi:hypothetical protein
MKWVVTLVILLLSVSCSTLPTANTALGKSIEIEAKTIKSKATSIDTQSVKATIKQHAKELIDAGDRLMSIAAKVDDTCSENAEFRNSETRKIKAKLAYIYLSVIVISTLGLLAGFAVIVFSHGTMGTLGIQVILVSVGGVCLGYSLLMYYQMMAVTGLIVLLLGCVAFVATLIKHGRIELELVKSVEQVKKREWNDETKESLNILQTQSTRNFVKSVKKKDKLK